MFPTPTNVDDRLTEAAAALEAGDLAQRVLAARVYRLPYARLKARVAVQAPRRFNILEQFVLRAAAELSPAPTPAELAGLLGLDVLFVESALRQLEGLQAVARRAGAAAPVALTAQGRQFLAQGQALQPPEHQPLSFIYRAGLEDLRLWLAPAPADADLPVLPGISAEAREHLAAQAQSAVKLPRVIAAAEAAGLRLHLPAEGRLLTAVDQVALDDLSFAAVGVIVVQDAASGQVRLRAYAVETQAADPALQALLDKWLKAGRLKLADFLPPAPEPDEPPAAPAVKPIVTAPALKPVSPPPAATASAPSPAPQALAPKPPAAVATSKPPAAAPVARPAAKPIAPPVVTKPPAATSPSAAADADDADDAGGDMPLEPSAIPPDAGHEYAERYRQYLSLPPAQRPAVPDVELLRAGGAASRSRQLLTATAHTALLLMPRLTPQTAGDALRTDLQTLAAHSVQTVVGWGTADEREDEPAAPTPGVVEALQRLLTPDGLPAAAVWWVGSLYGQDVVLDYTTLVSSVPGAAGEVSTYVITAPDLVTTALEDLEPSFARAARMAWHAAAGAPQQARVALQRCVLTWVAVRRPSEALSHVLKLAAQAAEEEPEAMLVAWEAFTATLLPLARRAAPPAALKALGLADALRRAVPEFLDWSDSLLAPGSSGMPPFVSALHPLLGQAALDDAGLPALLKSLLERWQAARPPGSTAPFAEAFSLPKDPDAARDRLAKKRRY
ncbi:MAG: hypothetical protein IT317_21095 [Anaerolineales bacterium]|nr:hypothetical protein [Anaerolineales bacterium]